jgi:hypothetical protein
MKEARGNYEAALGVHRVQVDDLVVAANPTTWGQIKSAYGK